MEDVACEPRQVDYPSPWLDQSYRRLFREHRTVVLPDFQGMGHLTAGLKRHDSSQCPIDINFFF